MKVMIVVTVISGICWIVSHIWKWPVEDLFTWVTLGLIYICLYMAGAFEGFFSGDTGHASGDICPRCHGSGAISNVDMGLGPHGLVPGYSKTTCPVCHGTGRVTYVQYTEDYGDEDEMQTCPRCNGKGTVIDISMGLGPNGFVPAYREVTCPECGGSGEI